MKALILILLSFALADDSRVALRTSVGDMVLSPGAGFPSFRSLAESEAFEGARVEKIDPDRFVKMTMSPGVRIDLGTPPSAQAKAGEVWMQADGTLFFFVASAPVESAVHVGTVSRGGDVLEAIRNLPFDDKRIELTNAFFVGSEKELEGLGLRGFSHTPDRRRFKSFASPAYFFAAGLLLVFGFAGFYFGRYRWRNAVASFGLTAVLTGSFLFFAGSISYPGLFPGQALLTFLLMLGVFKLMSQFEVN